MITLTGNFEALTGAGNGYVILTLINYETNIPRLYGGGVIVNLVYQTSPGANFSVNLWGNDAITPPNTYYQVAFYGAGQSLIATEIYQFNGSGTFDLSEVTPIVVTAPVPLGLAGVAYSGSYTDLSNAPFNGSQTVANGSTSGTVTFSQLFQLPSYKKVIALMNNLDGTASYTFPTPFTSMPDYTFGSSASGAILTALSTTGVTIEGAPSDGIITLEGF